jgi:hypothetical protein
MIRWIRDQYRTLIAFVALASVPAVIPSCMKDAPDRLPDTFEWNPSIAIPIGNARFGMNVESGFDTLLLELDSLTGWPEWVDETEIYIQGTIDFDLAMFSSNLDHLNRILFRVNIHNGFPEPMRTQAYFMDPYQNPVDSMFADGAMMVPAGTVRGNGETIRTAFAQRDVVFEKDRIISLQDASMILMRAILLNPDPDTALIPFYPTYHFDVQIGAMIDVTVSL